MDRVLKSQDFEVCYNATVVHKTILQNFSTEKRQTARFTSSADSTSAKIRPSPAAAACFKSYQPVARSWHPPLGCKRRISTDLSSMREVILAPPPTQPPLCFLCGQTSTRLVTKSSNPNGNVGRPYYFCLTCPRFLVFDDYRGNDPTNPECHCGYSSKRQATGRAKRLAGRLPYFYVCRLGTCNFYSPCRDRQEIDVFIDMDLGDCLAKLFMIWYDSFVASSSLKIITESYASDSLDGKVSAGLTRQFDFRAWLGEAQRQSHRHTSNGLDREESGSGIYS
ncbi:hypothetical protein F5Y12DRAFT_715377 [Xylaria sp. FL1777]|nr:hypothetical protein F5Y12DRAFT_715377 [Xylaria sp. FL1777]